MSVGTFNNPNLKLRVTAGVLTLVASPTVFAQTEAATAALKATQTQPPASTARALPKTSLFMNPPPQVPEAQRTIGVTDVLGRAFNRDDLSGLYGAGGFGACETSSRIPSFFEKNYSNFAASCMEDFRSRQAIYFDERFRANPDSEGIAVSPLGGGVQWASISSAARQRLLQRSINDLAKKNKTLADIMQGRISLDFGFGQFFSRGHSAQAKPEPARPRYVVEVIDPTPERRGKDRSRVASLGRIPETGMRKEGVWYVQKPTRARRTLKETFEPAATVSSSEESLIPSNMVASDANSNDSMSSLRYISRQAGLSDLPFTKVNMRAERRLVDGKNQFALRATESQDLFFAELPDVRQPSSDSVVWGYKIPWKKHAVAVRVDEGAQEKVTSYSFKVDDSNRSELNYNHKHNSLSAGFSVSF
jgi:hypothetical protein